MSEPEPWRYNVTRLSPTKSKVGSYVSSEDYESLATTVKALREERAEIADGLCGIVYLLDAGETQTGRLRLGELADRLASPSVPAEEGP